MFLGGVINGIWIMSLRAKKFIFIFQSVSKMNRKNMFLNFSKISLIFLFMWAFLLHQYLNIVFCLSIIKFDPSLLRH